MLGETVEGESSTVRYVSGLAALPTSIRDVDGFAAGIIDSQCGVDGQLIDMDVAGRDLAPGGDDADLRLLKILGFKTHGVEHGAAGGALGPIDHDGRKSAFTGIVRAGHFSRIFFHKSFSEIY